LISDEIESDENKTSILTGKKISVPGPEKVQAAILEKCLFGESANFAISCMK